MPHPEAAAAAARLMAQHGAGAPFDGIAPWPDAADEAFAYEVQDAYVALRRAAADGALGGYKIGLTTPRMQAFCGGDRPISGVVLQRGIQSSPARIERAAYVHLGVESELAVRIGRPLPGDATNVTRTDVSAAVDRVAAAFELIDDRGADYATLNWLWMAADNSWNAGLVLGPAMPAADIGDLECVLEIDGVSADRGTTADVLGHPFDAVAWLAAHLHRRGQSLLPGQWVSTGSIATIRFPEAGQHMRFTIKGLEPVELSVV